MWNMADDIDQLIKRINELAKLKKTKGLSQAELEEQKQLRQRYLGGFKTSLRTQLDTIKFTD